MIDTFDFTTRTGNATTTYRIRVVPLEGNPWFVAADCRNVLDIQKGGTNYSYLGADEKRVLEKGGLTTPLPNLFIGRSSRITLISESGLYKLIMRSDKPQARAFQEWVTREVLPTIRKTGGYVLQGADRATVGEGTVAEMPDVGGIMKAMAEMRAEMEAQFSKQLAEATAAVRAELMKVGLAVRAAKGQEYFSAREIRTFPTVPENLSTKDIGGLLTAYCDSHGISIKVEKRNTMYQRNLYPRRAIEALWKVPA